MLNSVNLMGRLVAAPVPRGKGDRLAAAFSLAVQRDYKDKDGERGVDFVDCVAFGKLGEFVLGHFEKGQLMCACGRLFVGSYVGEDGKQRKSCQVVLNDCYFCGIKRASVTDDEFRQLDEMYPL